MGREFRTKKGMESYVKHNLERAKSNAIPVDINITIRYIPKPTGPVSGKTSYFVKTIWKEISDRVLKKC